MSAVHNSPKRAYINVMEVLVAEEVDRQLKRLPTRVLKYVKRVEVETYALNRLPALYASSEKGWEYQSEKAKQELHAQIANAVRQAFAAVQVDPIRLSQPLTLMAESQEAQKALQALRDMLHQPNLSWDGIVQTVRQLISQGRVQPTPSPSSTDDQQTRVWRPGTYGREVAWKPHSSSVPSSAEQPFDWGDARR